MALPALLPVANPLVVQVTITKSQAVTLHYKGPPNVPTRWRLGRPPVRRVQIRDTRTRRGARARRRPPAASTRSGQDRNPDEPAAALIASRRRR